MRDIEFRFWSEKAKQMIDWELIKKECDRLSILKMDGFIPMQYTGLKDKNGKKIFEGDILKGDEWYNGDNLNKWVEGIVKYNNGSYWIDNMGHRYDFPPDLNREDISNYNIEIIGNIHEGKKI